MIKECAVIGASGKMGRGIALLLLEEIALQEEKPLLHLIDKDEDARVYLRNNLTRFAEKKINQLRSLYADNADLVSNKEMIETFVQEGMDRLRFSTEWQAAKDAEMIFEAIVEKEEEKVALFSFLKGVCSPETVYFTNTSSIPIGSLAKKSGIEGRLIGLHFFNPPPVQKLVEIISPEGVEDEVHRLAKEMAIRFNKVIVESADVAGFISNGFLIRELQMAEEMAKEVGVDRVNRMTKETLKRPMGIFTLTNFIGKNVLKEIAYVMGVTLELPECDESDETQDDTELAKTYLRKCREIGQLLVDEKIAKNKEDIDLVLTLGFHHPYGLINDAPF